MKVTFAPAQYADGTGTGYIASLLNAFGAVIAHGSQDDIGDTYAEALGKLVLRHPAHFNDLTISEEAVPPST